MDGSFKKSISKFNLLGAEVNALTIGELNYCVENIIKDGRKEIIANHNVHSIYLLKNDPVLNNFWEKSYLTHVDGTPLIWWGKFLGYPLRSENRVTYIDWIYPLLNTANSRGWKVFYLGSKPGVADKAVNRLKSSCQNVKFKTFHGYFNAEKVSEENKEVVNHINSFQPNILMVGMGMPRQEKWIIQNYGDLNANVILNCGACFDYIAGEQKTPPRILGRLGLEWFYRFLYNPRRLFKRYFIEPIWLTPEIIKDIRLKIKK